MSASDKLEGDLLLETGSDNPLEELFRLRGRLTYIMDLPAKMEACIGIELNQFELNPHEITLRFNIKNHIRVKVGYDENSMTLDEYYAGFVRPCNTISLITEYFQFQGYVARNIGFNIYTKYEEDIPGIPLSWRMKFMLSLPFVYEPQLEGGLYYHYRGKESYLGFSALYLPYIVHPINIAREFNPEHYFASTFTIADLGCPLIYSLETTFGSNIQDPIGLFSLPINDDRSYFWGIDGLIGWQHQNDKKMLWFHTLRYSLFIPDISSAQHLQQELVIGNQLYYSEEFKIYLDTGVKYTLAYGLLNNEDLWEWVWLIGFQVSTNGINLKNHFKSE